VTNKNKTIKLENLSLAELISKFIVSDKNKRIAKKVLTKTK
jgi:hypothetical protein